MAVIADLPGAAKEDIALSVEARCLTIAHAAAAAAERSELGGGGSGALDGGSVDGTAGNGVDRSPRFGGLFGRGRGDAAASAVPFDPRIGAPGTATGSAGGAGAWLLAERSPRGYRERRVQLPPGTDISSARASYENGVVSVLFGKAAREGGARRLEIV